MSHLFLSATVSDVTAHGAQCHGTSACAAAMIQVGNVSGGNLLGDSYDQESENGYQVLSSKGRNLGGAHGKLEEAKKRLRQVESNVAM